MASDTGLKTRIEKPADLKTRLTSKIKKRTLFGAELGS